MDEAKKKPLMIGLIVVCLVVAVAVTIKTWSPDNRGVPGSLKEEPMWVMCRNPACKATYEMSMYDYYKTIEDYLAAHPGIQIAPPLKCKECGKNSIYAAVKCEKCGNIFEKALKPGDFEDRCKCGFSLIEKQRNEKAGIVDE